MTGGDGDYLKSVIAAIDGPVLLVAVMVMLAILYYSPPNARVRGFKWVSAGSVLAVVVWVIASVGFAFYVANFGSYNKTYGALGGVITFLVWLWISNIAVLLGAELVGHQRPAHRRRRRARRHRCPARRASPCPSRSHRR